MIEQAYKRDAEGDIGWERAPDALGIEFGSTQEALRALKTVALKGVYRIIAIKRQKVVVNVEQKPLVSLA